MSDDSELERLRAENAALREHVAECEKREHTHNATEYMLRLVLDTIPQRVFWKDTEYQYLGCNKRFAQDARVEDPEGIVGRNDFELSWPESAQAYRDDDIAVIEEGKSKHAYDEPQVRHDGSRSWLRTTKVPLRDQAGTIIGVFGCYEDCTDERTALDALRASEERYRMLFEQASDGIFAADASGKYTAVNPAGCAMLGYAEAQLCQMNLGDLLVPEDLVERPLRLDELRRAGATANSTRRLVRKDGSLLTVEIGSSFTADGQFLAVVRDISARVAAEEQRRKAEERTRHAHKLESVGRLAGGIAHDFNNILTIILGQIHLLSRALGDGHEFRDQFGIIVTAADRASDLTRQLLAFSRKQVMLPTVFDVNESVTRIEPMLRRLLDANITVLVDRAAMPIPINADPAQLEQVLMNLAVNAQDAMPGGGTLRIATALVDTNGTPMATLSITDTGAGMDDDTRRHMFDPFFTTKAGDKGIGLGLAIVDGIVAQSGGTIDVETQLGQGTTFVVRLPASGNPVATRIVTNSQPAPAVATPARHDSAVTATILVAEDEQAVRTTITRILQHEGYKVVATKDGEQALAAQTKSGEPFDLLITDIIMPGMGGIALSELTRVQFPTTKILMMSGYSEKLASSSLKLGGNIQFLPKPSSPQSLLQAVSQLLQRDPPSHRQP